MKAYRVKSRLASERKWPADCFAIFSTTDFRNRILRLSIKKRLKIDGNNIIIHKIIPNRFLKKRDNYKQFIEALKSNSIDYRWEYPEGFSFYFKGKRRSCLSVTEAEKLWRTYGKDLGGKKRPGEPQGELDDRSEEETY